MTFLLAAVAIVASLWAAKHFGLLGGGDSVASLPNATPALIAFQDALTHAGIRTRPSRVQNMKTGTIDRIYMEIEGKSARSFFVFVCRDEATCQRLRDEDRQRKPGERVESNGTLLLKLPDELGAEDAQRVRSVFLALR
jgi:hypothetical protein